MSIETWVSIAVGVASLLAYWSVIRPWWMRRREKSFKRQQQLKIEQLEFELKWVKGHLSLPTFKLDADLNCTWVNRALRDLLGVDSSGLLDKVWFGIIHPDDLETVTGKWRRAVESRSRYRNRQRMFIHGRYRTTLVTGDPFVFNGKVQEYIGTVEMLDE